MADDSLDPGQQLAEREVSSETKYRGHYLELQVRRVERSDGSLHTRDILVHPGAVGIIALDGAGRVLLVRQWRVAAAAALLEIPAGTLDRGPDGATEDPALAAPRELEEETGQRAGAWRLLGSFWTAPGFATERMWLYLATDLRPATGDTLSPDDGEELQLERIPWRDAVAMAERGEICDAKSVAGLFWLARILDREGEPAR